MCLKIAFASHRWHVGSMLLTVSLLLRDPANDSPTYLAIGVLEMVAKICRIVRLVLQKHARCPISCLSKLDQTQPTSTLPLQSAPLLGQSQGDASHVMRNYPLPLTILREKRPTIINRRECIKKTNPTCLLRHEIPNSWVQPSLRSLLGDEDFLKASAVGVPWSCDVYKS